MKQLRQWMMVRIGNANVSHKWRTYVKRRVCRCQKRRTGWNGLARMMGTAGHAEDCRAGPDQPRSRSVFVPGGYRRKIRLRHSDAVANRRQGGLFMIPSTAEGALLDEAKDRPVALIRNLAAGPVLVLAPHPDDETFSCGMAIAEAVVENIPEHIVVVTAGEASHPNSIAYRDARLKACRYLEFQNAVDELGGGGITFQVLNYPDGRLGPDHVAELADRTVSIGAERKTEAIWATWDGDPPLRSLSGCQCCTER